MKGFGAGLLVGITALALAGCGGDNTTTFVLTSGSPSASGSASASASASPSAGASGSPASSSLPTTAATPIDGTGKLKIIIDSPDSGTAISSPVKVSGTASVDKGTVVAVVLDASGTELGRATATASASKPDFGHFDVTVTFSGGTPGAKGQIKVFGVSPRDGTTPTNYYFITVRFA
jgi:Immunoglobulin-like domain of bacterial spore germination